MEKNAKKERHDQVLQTERLLKKQVSYYKITLYILIITVVIYFSLLFVWKKKTNDSMTIISCLVMMGAALINAYISRKMRRLAVLLESLKKPIKTTERQSKKSSKVGTLVVDDPAVTEGASLNDLPEMYTVLDDVNLNKEHYSHIVLSPYEVSVVAHNANTAPVDSLLKSLEFSGIPVQTYDPDMKINKLLIALQRNKLVSMEEWQIMRILRAILDLPQ